MDELLAGGGDRRSNKLSFSLGSGAHAALNESQLMLIWLAACAPFKKEERGWTSSSSDDDGRAEKLTWKRTEKSSLSH